MKTIIGTFVRPDGTVASGATLTLLISQDAVASGQGVIEHAPVTVTLDDTGSIPADTTIWANDELLPSGTYYVVSVKDQDYGQIYFERLTISGFSPIDLSTIAPELV